jgi:ABC-type transport system involved in multi-copper enzyme maturation permease subunit
VPLLALILAGLASQSMAAELGAGTLRNLLLRPLYRFEIVLGKLLALLVVAVLSYLLLLAVAASSAGIALDYGNLVEVLTTGAGTFPLLDAKEVWPRLWPAIASPILPLVGFMSLGFLCGSVVRVAAGALALSLAVVVGLDLFRAFAHRTFLEAWLPSTYVSSPLAADSHLHYFVEFSSGVSRGPFDYHGTEILVPVLWALVCAAVAVLIFRRRYVP